MLTKIMVPAIAALALGLSGCSTAATSAGPTAGALSPYAYTPPAPLPTEVAEWGQTVDNGKGVSFTVAAPEWATNYDGRPVLKLAVTTTNNGQADLTNTGITEMHTDKGSTSLEAGPSDSMTTVPPVTLLAGESSTTNSYVGVPDGATTLRVTIAQGMATAGGLGDQLAKNIHFRGPIPAASAAPAADTEDQTSTEDTSTEQTSPEESQSTETEGTEGSTDGLESLCSDASWRSSQGDAGDSQCGGDWDGSSASSSSATEDDNTTYGPMPDGSTGERDKTSGETQLEWGCQQGYITEGC